MSDDEKDLDLGSDDENLNCLDLSSGVGNEHEKRAHHNALERKRRDHIKDSFTGLKDCVPTLQGDKTSRAQILKKATEYIGFMRQKNVSHTSDIQDLRRQNQHLENQIRILEEAKSSGRYDIIKDIEEVETEEEKERKRLKTE